MAKSAQPQTTGTVSTRTLVIAFLSVCLALVAWRMPDTGDAALTFIASCAVLDRLVRRSERKG
ncbi:hypothetical protein Ais01nite_51690 [Asanoa ishikariensis]|uniref:Uncharacterized protein n=1 Tax=Asanoa ishikariensis TaxID=137265 RepID=A0A1H3RK18_9ACTN|nr:hypothetical protein Ais01nite_51690 [Asanoa ishikariensis]SDZ25970.1 hypothetical protein SAMN05421684_3909 [Asanoa ishikariensis]